MALFGTEKASKNTNTQRKVRPVVVRTQNVASEIFKVAKSYEIEPDTLDFHLFEVQTYTRIMLDDNSANSEWQERAVEELKELDTEQELLNPNFQIKQVYEIEIFLKHLDPANPCANFKTAVGANATKSKVYLSISAGSKIHSYSKFNDDFVNMINKRKIRAGILIYIFDDMVERLVDKFSAQLKVAQEIAFTKNETYLIAEAYEPTATINDKLILHYESNKKIDEHTKIDYAARGFIQNVKENDLLIEYIKPQAGKPGRNCRGEYMKPAEPLVNHEATFSIDEETIKVVEDEKSIKYFAKENGYIALENNTYLIKTEVDVGEISFKTTGSIDSGIDSDVNISVREADAVKDAVGSGMSVEVTEIEIDGNVGSHAKVIAKIATIGGQTHKTAMVRANELDINVHKGKAYGKNIRVERLEHGEIDGDIVHITQALGGRIRAREITISVCSSHVHATASKFIEIKRMVGSENIFTIDPLLKKGEQAGVSEHKHKIEELEKELRDIKNEMQKYTRLIKDGTAAFIDIKKRLVHYKKNGVKMPESFVKKYKQFQAMQAKLKELHSKNEVTQDQLKLLTTRTASFQDNIFDARVINRDTWKGYNEIKFKLVDPPMELVYKPAENSQDKIFGLVQLNDDEYAIRPMKEE
ncbi:flagellar assembly protein A [Sulfurimonas sp.]